MRPPYFVVFFNMPKQRVLGVAVSQRRRHVLADKPRLAVLLYCPDASMLFLPNFAPLRILPPRGHVSLLPCGSGLTRRNAGTAYRLFLYHFCTRFCTCILFARSLFDIHFSAFARSSLSFLGAQKMKDTYTRLLNNSMRL